ncbi:MAG: hypothetical protein SPK52_01790 [Synergistales bacterium]|nr:hypothetical protein [Bacteroidales bacterium]MDY6424490.1 hypothetical protein [Bacteroidales bacterium]MDY6434928.1 hypothetical protein [Synergistales bacterium]
MVNCLENTNQELEIRLRIVSRFGVDSFPTYLVHGISRRPTIKVSS